MAEVTVTVSDDHLGRIEEVADELRARGMTVDQVLATVGVISGRLPDDRMTTLDAVDGVAAVEQSRTVHGPPPGLDP
jgi:hypothetical protein